jgi:hypothetical protein
MATKEEREGLQIIACFFLIVAVLVILITLVVV